MSKWNKPAKQPSQQFLQNEERRRQMIIEASKRRREKEKKLQQLNENLRKNEQQALERHKKQKQEAYQKYLKSNNNMHDKYEQIKRNEKMQEQPKKEVSKWKRRDNSAQTKNIEGLDLEKSHGKVKQQQSTNMAVKKQVVGKGVEAKKAVEQEFEKQWAEQAGSVGEELLGSKLLDSLDLDIDTMERGRQLTDKLQKIKKLGQEKPTIDKDEVEQIKNLIGYESLLVSFDNQTQQPSIKQTISSKNINQNAMNTGANKNNKQKVNANNDKKQLNEQQAFNNLKNKKQGKIFEWASNKVEEADDLFSNCSSNKNSLSRNNIKDNSKEKGGSKKGLQPIPQKANRSANKSVDKQKQRKSVEKLPNTPSIPSNNKIAVPVKNNSQNQFRNVRQGKEPQKVLSQERADKSNERSDKRIPDKANTRIPQINNENKSHNRSVSKQKIKQNQAAFQKDKQKSLQKLRQRKFSAQRTTSAQKPRKAPIPAQVPKTQQPFRSQKPLPPLAPKQTYTVATHQQYFDVQSFIMNDLVQLNEEQRKLQQQIRYIHVQNKAKVKQIQNKHEIKTNYKSSGSLINRHEGKDVAEDQGNGYGYGYGAIHGNLNQELIQDSIQRLDDFMIKREIHSREKTHISQQSNIKSIINPFSKPEDFQKQILQLAQNISKFQNQPDQDTRGYGYQHKQKKKPQKADIPQQISISRTTEQAGLRPNQQKGQKGTQMKIKMSTPPILQYSSKNNEIIEVNMEQQYYDPEDSLDTMKREKVQVNQRLKGILFDD